MSTINQSELGEILCVIEALEGIGLSQINLEVAVNDVNGEVLGYIVGGEGEYILSTNKEEEI